MNFDVEKRTFYKVIHGSRAYGTNVATSDTDIKGVCIEPQLYFFGFLHKFEQQVREAAKGHEHDAVIYSLKKFASLASDCNPNIIEVLYVDDSDVLHCDEFGEQLRSNRDIFLSKKAFHTFSGYAHSQMKRIKTHRSWLLNPPSEPPTRKEQSLPEFFKLSKSEMGTFEELSEDAVKELPKHVTELYLRERAHQSQVRQWKQYQNWKATRNKSRSALEEKFGYDTKHAGHLIRLMRMCKEILETGNVVVKRPDAEELLEIRHGRWSYDELIEHADALNEEGRKAYDTSKLPHSSNKNKVNDLVIDITMKYLYKNG